MRKVGDANTKSLQPLLERQIRLYVLFAGDKTKMRTGIVAHERNRDKDKRGLPRSVRGFIFEPPQESDR